MESVREEPISSSVALWCYAGVFGKVHVLVTSSACSQILFGHFWSKLMTLQVKCKLLLWALSLLSSWPPILYGPCSEIQRQRCVLTGRCHPAPLAGDCVDSKEENSRHPTPHLRFRTICRHMFNSDLNACPATRAAPCKGFPPLLCSYICLGQLRHIPGCSISFSLWKFDGAAVQLVLCGKVTARRIMYRVGCEG